MPSIIPYNPSLVLGNLVSQDALQIIEQIATNDAAADAAEDNLNSMISLKRSIDMTIQEVAEMGVDTTDIAKQSDDLGKDIVTAATAYATAKVTAEKDNVTQKAKLRIINDSPESPIDYNKSEIKTMPLAADSIKMNVQYFSFDENEQNSTTSATAVKSYVAAQAKVLGNEFSSQLAVAAQEQMNDQYSRHSIVGTLVISAVCTHKDARIFAPYVLDVDKAIRVWNMVNTGDLIDTTSQSAITADASSQDTKSKLTLLSGATYGSAFVGMVHVLNTTATQASETMMSIASSLQAQFAVNLATNKMAGGFGIDANFANDVKNLLSSQTITTHCSLVVMGVIPTIKSNAVKLGVMEFSKFDGAEAMTQLSALANFTGGEKDSITKSASDSRTGQEMLTMQSSKINAVLEGLSGIDDRSNQIIDINSVMTAYDDYTQKAMEGNIGVPINYYLKDITKEELVEMWVAKYFPGQYLDETGDDTAPAAAGGGQQAPSGSTPPPSGS